MSTGARDRAEPMEAPDLFGLDYQTRVRIAVAVIQGFWWECKQGDGWWCLRNPADPTFPAAAGAHSFEVTNRLPDYLRDPAAWGALMEDERIALMPVEGVGWAAWSFDGNTPSEPDHTAERPGLAVCLAVLAKHGITVEP